MKRIIVLVMAAAMLPGGASLASAAVESKVSGHMHINFSLLDNATSDVAEAAFDADAPEDNFIAAQRFRPRLTMQAEGVTAVFEAQQQQAIWGRDFPVNASSGMTINIQEAYVDFRLPGTPLNLKTGYQTISLPSIWGHPVFDARVGGVLASLPFNDEVSLVAFWAQPGIAEDTSVTPTVPATDKAYIGGALLHLGFGSVNVVPYLAYYDTRAENIFVGGANLELLPSEALSIKADLIATSHSSDEDGGDDIGTGFMLAAAVDYALPWGAPGLLAWYATGGDKNGEGAFQSVATEGFGPSTWGFAGGNTFGYDSQISDSGVSTAALGAQVADLSFIDGLTHTARLLYVMGTADNSQSDVPTTDHTFIEANLDSDWAIYENLSAAVELGLIVPDIKGEDADPAMKAQLTLRFSF